MLKHNSLNATHTTTGLWPTAEQKHLLKATTMTGADAHEAYCRWRASIGQQASLESLGPETLNTIDRATLRLLPMVHHQLRSLNVKDPLSASIADVYLDSWLRLNLNLSSILPLLRLCEEKSIDTLLLKGAPLAYEYYPVPETRPMADFDVLIKSVDIQNAIDVLADAGWHPTRKLIADDFRYRHAQSFINPQGVEFDFHWHVMSACCDDHADNEFWNRSLPFDLQGVGTRRLDATDCLMHTLVHGVAWNAEPAIRWIPDSMLILQKDSEKIDWDRIVLFASRFRLTYRLSLALSYLREEMGVVVPESTIEKLKEHPVSLIERLEHRPRKLRYLKISANTNLAPKTSLLEQILQFLRHKIGASRHQDKETGYTRGFLAFLVYKHRVGTIGEVMFIYARRLARIIRPNGTKKC